MARIYDNLADTFGNTPLVKISRLTQGLKATILVKMESFNPGGSVKDRIGVAMIEAAERDGRFTPEHGHRRTDQRQHGCCAGDGCCSQRLSDHFDHAGNDDDRTPQPA